MADLVVYAGRLLVDDGRGMWLELPYGGVVSYEMEARILGGT